MAAPPQTRRDGDGESGGGIGTLLHRDALYEILLRVPAKPFCRFRAVCRSWRSLLSAPSSFVAAHAARHRRDPPLLAVCDLVPGSGDDRPAEIKLLDTSGRVVKRLGAGPLSLLCRVWPHLELVLVVRCVAATDRHPRPLSVLDPATGDVCLLPGGHDSYGARDVTHSSFVFGRTGGGGDGEYKVLSLSTSRHYGMRNLCKILTVDAGGGSHGEWRDAPAPPVVLETFHRHTLVASGMVYHLVDRSNGWTIAAFDLEAVAEPAEIPRGAGRPRIFMVFV
nr:unnamed protein product [Digitaria exilis]